jgi:DNA-directed RNA polymerase specialized sigma24 family protein
MLAAVFAAIFEGAKQWKSCGKLAGWSFACAPNSMKNRLLQDDMRIKSEQMVNVSPFLDPHPQKG